MNRSRRAVLATAAASTIAAGAGAAIVYGPLAPSQAATSAQPAQLAQPASGSPAPVQADMSVLDAALSKLGTQTTALQAELAAARKRLDDAASAARAAAADGAATAVAATRSSVRARTTASRSTPPARPAPVVHARTGASGAAGAGGGEQEGQDD